nr:Hsp20/alpha crystallin family protein [Neobacillus terrae]
MDVFKTENHFYVTLDLAGADRKDFSLRLEKTTLIVEGVIHNSFSPDIMQSIVSERFYGPFKREIPLTHEYRLDKLTAEFAKGILIVSIPKD